MAREQQRLRTRKDLLQAAARLMAEGKSPTLDEVAEAAMVSRATAYRYFQGIDALILEASLDLDAPVPAMLQGEGAPGGLTERLEFVDFALGAMMARNEPQLRAMLMHSLQARLKGGDETPVRQNRRLPLIEAAIGGADQPLPAAIAEKLARAIALVIGTESMIVFKDVLQIGEAEARDVRRWAIRALAEAAQREADS